MQQNMVLPSHFQSEPLRSSCSDWSWDRFGFLITTLHIALQLLITSLSDLHKHKHGKLHHSKPHNRSSYVNYLRPPISRTAQPCPVLMQRHICHQIICSLLTLLNLHELQMKELKQNSESKMHELHHVYFEQNYPSWGQFSHKCFQLILTV